MRIAILSDIHGNLSALEAVAEGVENIEQAIVLRELGYTLGQGYHLAQPMTADDVALLLARQQPMTAAER